MRVIKHCTHYRRQLEPPIMDQTVRQIVKYQQNRWYWPDIDIYGNCFNYIT